MRGIDWCKENTVVFKKEYGIVNCKLHIFSSPQLLSMPARLANRLGLVTPLQVAENVTCDIPNSVRRNLEDQYSSFESSEAREQDINDNLEQD